MGNLRTNCSTWTTSAAVSTSYSASSHTPTTNTERTLELPLPFPLLFLLLLPLLHLLLLFLLLLFILLTPSLIALTSAAVASVMLIKITHNPDTPTNTDINSVKIGDENPAFACPHCNRTFPSHVGLVGRLRIHRTGTGEPVHGASTYIRRICLNCHHCTRTLTNRVGLLGHMRVRDNLRLITATYARPSHLPPQPTSRDVLAHHKHPAATSLASGKCASRLLLFLIATVP
nr:unnamed protein product [Spirometra erinaceieuropaei]